METIDLSKVGDDLVEKVNDFSPFIQASFAQYLSELYGYSIDPNSLPCISFFTDAISPEMNDPDIQLTNYSETVFGRTINSVTIPPAAITYVAQRSFERIKGQVENRVNLFGYIPDEELYSHLQLNAAVRIIVMKLVDYFGSCENFTTEDEQTVLSNAVAVWNSRG